MNEAPNSQTGLSDTFSSQPAPQTNPFTADLKGEFTSNFGTNTNAVSQIFKEGGFVGQNRNRNIIIGAVAVVVVLLLGYFMFFGDDSTDSFPTADDTAEDAAADVAAEDTVDDAAADTATDETTADEEATTDEAAESTASVDATTDAPAPFKNSVPSSIPSGASFGSGPATLTEPAEGSQINYDESQGPAVFNWTGGGGHIVFSRNQSMNPPALRIRVNGNSYAFHHPWPGTWYWRVENSSGQTEVRSFKVNPPQRRTIALQQPGPGGAVAGTGGTVTWQGDAKVAFYRVEVTNGGWTNPTHRFASSGNSVALNGVAPGQYQMRVGAFSEVSGRWEYTAPVAVTVQ